ncbi:MULTISPECIES: TIGR03943 family putative permease subunit [Dactylosporangium]|uniref:Membrane protein n=2 Tax=Dactylosporangium TaxID=35753 RepID=A0A9W6KSW8_9ACTN|nr:MULTISPECIES: TIGR03943 family protein [Dactylosporangium]UAB95381.1 TIGR03943 family protein [Dactylosporangium vinaceum]UWZ43703.1 TIGR03943 family protein [Dactylosporangium matsuzakiense]GLL05810.1 membrane protein [Dactylosporangium matsuzakiense]
MNKQAQAVVLLLIGGAVLRVSLTGQYLNYVKASLQPYLVTAGALLVLAGAFTLWYELRGVREADDGHGHAHSGPKVAWLLLAPVLGLLLFAPPALGSYAAGRSGSAVTAQSEYAPLPAGDPLAITMLDYASRAVFDKGVSLGERRLQLTGFAMKGPQDQWLLARMMVSCCAADARPVKVALDGELPDGLADQQWVRVIGKYSGREIQDDVNGEAIPFIEVSEVTLIPVPQEQYES